MTLGGLVVWTSCNKDRCVDTSTCVPIVPCGPDGSLVPVSACPSDAGDADVLIAPPGCDLTQSPKDSEACVDDSVGVFVAPDGDDGATGNKNAPVKSVAKAVALAVSRGLPRVYVCEGTYDGNVKINAPVSIFGGFSCLWTSAGTKAKIAPLKGIALRVASVNRRVVLESLEILGRADLSVPGDSAIASFVSGSADVTLRDVKLTAEAGVEGASGTTGSNYAASASGGGGANGAGRPQARNSLLRMASQRRAVVVVPRPSRVQTLVVVVAAAAAAVPADAVGRTGVRASRFFRSIPLSGSRTESSPPAQEERGAAAVLDRPRSRSARHSSALRAKLASTDHRH